MESFMQKFIEIVKCSSKNLPIPKMKIDPQELMDIQELLLDFSHLISYEDSEELRDRVLLKNAIEDGLFFDESFAEGTIQYDSLLNQYKELKTLKEGETFSIANQDATKASNNQVNTVYRREKNGVIRKYTQLMPLYDFDPAYYPKYYYDSLKKNLDFEQDGDKLFLLTPGAPDRASLFVSGDKLTLLYYDIRNNPFSKKHFRIFGPDGEIEDISKFNYTHLIKRIRDAEAHHKVYSYFKGFAYGAKVVPLGDGKVALFSSRWHEYLMQTAFSSIDKTMWEFSALCVPNSHKPITSDAECIEKIDSIKRIKVYTKNMQNSVYAYAWLKKIIESYEVSPTKNITIEEYFNKHLPKWLGDCECAIEPLGNTQLLKARLVGQQPFYNIYDNDKENALGQIDVIKHLLDGVYDRAFTTSEGISHNGKIQPIHVDLQELYLILRTELPRVQNLAGLRKGAKWQKYTAPFAGVEKQLTLPILCAYKNLIRNHFMDDVVKYAQAPAGFALKGAQQDGKQKISLLDMDIFEIYRKTKNKTEVENPRNFDQKANVLRALRNAISHNRMYVQFNKNCDLAESKYVFDLGEHSQVKVNVIKFLDFINQPIFADHKSMDKYTIKAQNTKELKEFIKQMCKNEIEFGRDHEWTEE